MILNTSALGQWHTLTKPNKIAVPKPLNENAKATTKVIKCVSHLCGCGFIKFQILIEMLQSSE